MNDDTPDGPRKRSSADGRSRASGRNVSVRSSSRGNLDLEIAEEERADARESLDVVLAELAVIRKTLDPDGGPIRSVSSNARGTVSKHSSDELKDRLGSGGSKRTLMHGARVTHTATLGSQQSGARQVDRLMEIADDIMTEEIYEDDMPASPAPRHESDGRRSIQRSSKQGISSYVVEGLLLSNQLIKPDPGSFCHKLGVVLRHLRSGYHEGLQNIDMDVTVARQMATPTHSYMIHPSSTKRVCWDIAYGLLVLIDCIITPLTVGFGIKVGETGYEYVFFTTLIFATGMVLDVFTGYWKKSNVVMQQVTETAAQTATKLAAQLSETNYGCEE
jgi:hypothetical protein